MAMATFILTWDASPAGYDPTVYAAHIATTAAGGTVEIVAALPVPHPSLEGAGDLPHPGTPLAELPPDHRVACHLPALEQREKHGPPPVQSAVESYPAKTDSGDGVQEWPWLIAGFGDLFEHVDEPLRHLGGS